MWKKIIIAWILVFITMGILDWIANSLILMGIYQETESLWRPMEEMKWWVGYLASLISTFCFVYVYAKFVSPKSMKNSIIYGLFWGIAIGAGMGYGTYAYMPIPYSLAAGWFWSTIVTMTASGLVLGLIIKENN
ncbi:hypothetical protein D9V86_07485 [Bacteroidetes/Chlorobi group bacterium ChocPot_Mid]|jgi:hypothetical protein|nr:MAG: hypothetical protein D9V86_07485 [Bacteroidetes/Chlorobi group bacterium ChocPot_Mid]